MSQTPDRLPAREARRKAQQALARAEDALEEKVDRLVRAETHRRMQYNLRWLPRLFPVMRQPTDIEQVRLAVIDVFAGELTQGPAKKALALTSRERRHLRIARRFLSRIAHREDTATVRPEEWTLFR